MHDVVDEGVLGGVANGIGLSADCAERTEHNLGDDGTELAGGGGDTVAGRAVSCWETFTLMRSQYNSDVVNRRRDLQER